MGEVGVMPQISYHFIVVAVDEASYFPWEGVLDRVYFFP